MKTQGLRIEDSQLESAERLMKMVAIAARAAAIVIQLVQARNGGEELDAGSGGKQGVQFDAMEECRKQHLATPEPQCLRDREDPITGEGEGAPAGIGEWKGHRGRCAGPQHRGPERGKQRNPGPRSGRGRRGRFSRPRQRRHAATRRRPSWRTARARG